jgi:hypothetical protein
MVILLLLPSCVVRRKRHELSPALWLTPFVPENRQFALLYQSLYTRNITDIFQAFILGKYLKVRIRGQMTIADIRQALFEQLHELETKYAVQFSRGATLYINPTNAFGEDVTPRMPGGHELRRLYSTGPYRSAADEGKL